MICPTTCSLTVATEFAGADAKFAALRSEWTVPTGPDDVRKVRGAKRRSVQRLVTRNRQERFDGRLEPIEFGD